MSSQHDKRESGIFDRTVPLYEWAQMPNAPPTAAGATGAIHDAIRSLTPRQREVLAVMMQGKCNKGICRVLKLAEPTVKNHVTAILKALNATNRTEAVVKAARASASPTSYMYTVSGLSTFLHGSSVPTGAVDAQAGD
jgi:DNA-binding CsgD family transcriptional regulator